VVKDQCCEAIPLAVTQEQVRMKLPGQIGARTRRWILDELVPISRREVRRLYPWRLDHVELPRDPHTGEFIADYPTFYRCLNFEPETRRCLAYDDRPDECAGYPEYGGPIDRAIALPPRCSFRADIGEPIEDWQPVTIGRR
jgi:Fe-S-cluster containining protein